MSTAVSGKGSEDPQPPVDDSNRMDEDGEVQQSADGAMDADQEEDQIELRNPELRPVYKLSVKLLDTYKYINKVNKLHFMSLQLVLTSNILYV